MFSFSQIWSRLRIQNSRSRIKNSQSRPKTGRLRNPAEGYSISQLKNKNVLHEDSVFYIYAFSQCCESVSFDTDADIGSC